MQFTRQVRLRLGQQVGRRGTKSTRRYIVISLKFSSGNTKKAVGYRNLEFQEDIIAGDINVGI